MMKKNEIARGSALNDVAKTEFSARLNDCASQEVSIGTFLGMTSGKTKKQKKINKVKARKMKNSKMKEKNCWKIFDKLENFLKLFFEIIFQRISQISVSIISLRLVH
jgi:hypothetical protein